MIRTDGPRRLKVAFAGLFGSPNLGNEATLYAFLANVSRRLPGTRFACIAPRQSDIERQRGVPLVPIDPLPVGQYFWRVGPQSLRRRLEGIAQRFTEGARTRCACRELDGVDVLALPGTGLFDDFGQGPLDLPSHLDRWTRAARSIDARADYISVGVSTVHHAESKTLFTATLKRATSCSFRDERSLEHAAALGMDRRRGRVFPDLAFSLPREILPPARLPGSPAVVGVGLMGYYGWNRGVAEGEAIYNDYLDRISRLVEALVHRGLGVQLMIGDARADRNVSADVLRRCVQMGVSADAVRPAGLPDFQGVLAQIASVDAVIATRFHNVLFSILLEKPLISLSYADKNDSLMKAWGLGAYCHDVERFAVSDIIQQLEELTGDPVARVATRREANEEARGALDRQYDELCGLWLDRVS